jgi:uncharacterized HAD superfamily protein
MYEIYHGAEEQPLIGVDLDGVLVDFNEAFLNCINNKNATNWAKHHVTHYDYQYCIGIEEKEVYETFANMASDGSYARLNPMPLHRLVNLLPGRVHLVTHRVATLQADTRSWLNEHKVHKYEKLVHVVGSKANYIRSEYGRFNYFIEDSLKNALDVSEVCDTVFLVDHPYNQADSLPSNVIRVHSWTEILEHFITQYSPSTITH